jgi:hypothetical protein
MLSSFEHQEKKWKAASSSRKQTRRTDWPEQKGEAEQKGETKNI